jgi:three-Cys-motif partner protein
MEEPTTLPPILPHTEAKHDILRYHMGAWFPILGRSSSGTLQYVDGFAGPGEYAGGEHGSPIIALETISRHPYNDDFQRAQRRFAFLFVERVEESVNQLRPRVNSQSWPVGFEIDIVHGEFESVMSAMLNEVDAGARSMYPTLLFIDPFGSAGFSMNLLRRLARFQRIDILINFNYLDLNRWILSDPTKHITLHGLYGNDRWEPALQLEGDDRKELLIREYGAALRQAGWRSTNFEMINNHNQTQYYLFFATRASRGLQVIKQAMRSVSPDGLIRYADRSDPTQLRFIDMGMDVAYAEELSEHLFHRYHGSAVTKESIIDDDIAWHPRWIDKDPTAALRLLESSSPPRITSVHNPDGRPRRRTFYPSGCIITFAP